MLAIAEDHRQLEPAVEGEGHALERRVGLPRPRVSDERVGMREDVVGDDDRAGLDLRTRELEELLVLLLLGVEEDRVEDVINRGQGLEGVSRQQFGPVFETGFGDVAAPGVDLRRVVLEREDPPTEVADAGGEPDRGIAARAADLEHLAVGLRRDEREEELAGGARDLACALLARDALLALAGVLLFEAREHGADAFVEHGRERTGPLNVHARARPSVGGGWDGASTSRTRV